MAKKNGDKSCQSNLDKRESDFGSFLVIKLLLYHKNNPKKSSKKSFQNFIKIPGVCLQMLQVIYLGQLLDPRKFLKGGS